jgi:hypothetical protein
MPPPPTPHGRPDLAHRAPSQFLSHLHVFTGMKLPLLLSNTTTRAWHDSCADPMGRVPHIAARDSRRPRHRETCVEHNASFCAYASFFTDQPRIDAYSVIWFTQHMSGNVAAAPPSTSPPRCNSSSKTPDASCAVLQVNDTGPNANRKAPPHPHDGRHTWSRQSA